MAKSELQTPKKSATLCSQPHEIAIPRWMNSFTTQSNDSEGTQQKMVADLTFSTANDILSSWEELRRIPNYEEVVGVQVFKRLFSECPSSRQVFSFGHKEVKDEEFYKSKQLLTHASFFVKMLDRSVMLLGPDIELLTDILLDLGKKHQTYGVKTDFYEPMGRALLETMEELLGERFTSEIRSSWINVYAAMSYDMVRASSR